MSDSGLFASVQRVLDNVLSIAQTRLELLAVEFHEERCRMIETLIWVSASIFLTALAVIITLITIVFIAWESREARAYALIGLSALSVLSAIGSFVMFQKKLKEISKPFAASLDELRKDRSCLTSNN